MQPYNFLHVLFSFHFQILMTGVYHKSDCYHVMFDHEGNLDIVKEICLLLCIQRIFTEHVHFKLNYNVLSMSEELHQYIVTYLRL